MRHGLIKLVNAYKVEEGKQILYELLKERTPEQSISHRRLPEFFEHVAFVDSHPYRCWYLIDSAGIYVGSVYLTKKHEIGISIFNEYKGKGFGTLAIKEIMRRWPGRFLANINPNNKDSIKFFEKLGFRHIQNTYAI